MRMSLRLPFAACLLAIVPPAFAADPAAPAPDPVQLDRIEVASTRLRGVEAFDIPASISLIDIDDRDATARTAADLLRGVPGLLARDRQNYAQDIQLALRGFGARATFGVRGLRVFVDGIPATMPDGQGQVSQIALAGVSRVEVLRGPFSALFGNSSGGVVQVFSADGEAPARGHVQADLAGDDARNLDASFGGARGDIDYALAGNAFRTDGWRDHGAARRTTFNAKLGFALPGEGRVQLVANAFDSPQAQDPLGLDWTQVQADPRQATASAYQFDTRKSARQNQLGATLEQPLHGGQRLRVTGYAGQRDIEQYLAVPVAAQANPLSGGGVVDLRGDYAGADLRWSWRGTLGGGEIELDAGLEADRQRQHRRGFENFAGDALGVRGALRRDERDDASDIDQYAQAWWRFAPRWALLAGARHSRVEFVARDAYIAAGNPDDSGRVAHSQSTPVAGLVFMPGERLRFHASAGRGFETPTFNELAYRADGGAGLAFDLKPAVSRNLELGGKWRGRDGASLEAAWFRADTDDELAVAGNIGGRSSYRNAGRARRQGFELSSRLPFGEAWRLDLAATWLDAYFRDGFLACSGNGCATPSTQVPAGARIPGTARRQLQARLDWSHGAWETALEASALGAVDANDTGSAHAPGYALFALELAREWRPGGQALRAFARIDNLFDRRYIGSVIVNEGNGRYYEPGPGRGLWLGLRWNWTARAAR